MQMKRNDSRSDILKVKGLKIVYFDFLETVALEANSKCLRHFYWIF